MNRYWESEPPTTITTAKNVLQYYNKAEKLSVARPPWVDKDGKERQGKTVCLDVAALTESSPEVLSAAREMFAEIVQSIDRRLNIMGG